MLLTPSPLYLQFYAPWCGYCKKLEPIWNEVGLELKTSGSPVRVGKMDATAYSGESAQEISPVELDYYSKRLQDNTLNFNITSNSLALEMANR